MKCVSAQSCPILCNPVGCRPPGSCPWDFPGKNTEVGCHFLLQGNRMKGSVYIHNSVLVAQTCLILCDPHGLQPAGLLCSQNSLGKNTGVDSHSLLQGIFLTQGMNPGLLHCRFFTVWATREAHRLCWSVGLSVIAWAAAASFNWGTRHSQYL